MRVAYLTGRYPAISHTFIMREVRALRALGIEVDTFSVWSTDENLLLARADKEEYKTTYALLAPRLAYIARAHVMAVLTRPRRYLATARRAFKLRGPGLRGWGVAVTWLVETIVLWHQCRQRAITHVHAHLNGTAPTVALLLANFANDLDAGGVGWTWSQTVHGPSEFYDTIGEHLAEKIRSATFVVCISDFARSQLMGLVEASHWPKLHVVHCGVDLDVFRPVDAQPVSSGPSRTFRILNVGRLVSVKGHAALIEAVALVRGKNIDASLTIVGEGPARPELERIVAGLDLRSHVHLTGAVGQDEILELYRASDVFCMSSFAEGVPVVLMEAMAQEIPVIAPAIMGIPELIENGVNGILTRPGRPDQIADGLSRLALSPELRLELGRNARRFIISDFDINQSAEKLRDLFCGNRSSSSSSSSSSSAAAAGPSER
jgi:colanic acid/amylovoran biosynthesis glycosyltransferase